MQAVVILGTTILVLVLAGGGTILGVYLYSQQQEKRDQESHKSESAKSPSHGGSYSDVGYGSEDNYYAEGYDSQVPYSAPQYYYMPPPDNLYQANASPPAPLQPAQPVLDQQPSPLDQPKPIQQGLPPPTELQEPQGLAPPPLTTQTSPSAPTPKLPLPSQPPLSSVSPPPQLPQASLSLSESETESEGSSSLSSNSPEKSVVTQGQEQKVTGAIPGPEGFPYEETDQPAPCLKAEDQITLQTIPKESTILSNESSDTDQHTATASSNVVFTGPVLSAPPNINASTKGLLPHQ
jgi:hypothetical protein